MELLLEYGMLACKPAKAPILDQSKKKKDKNETESALKVEYRAINSVTCEVMWILKILKDLNVDVELLSVSCDSSSAIQIAANLMFHERTKHFEIDLYFLKEKVSAGLIKTCKIKSEDNGVKSLRIEDDQVGKCKATLGGNWSWHFTPRGRAIDDLASLASSIGNLSLLMDGMDRWHVGEHHYWNSWIPRKVNICVWRAFLNRLSSRSNLASRGVVLESLTCLFCECVDEDLEHCMIRCPLVLLIWRKIWSWWNLDSPAMFPSFLVSDIIVGTIKPNGNS
ncbi:RNA-directed DNA polymerase, eukaryota, reverse transcriptase zinc-binding domain protein [Tanacetum coccineum]